jgi:hypothetical protein
VGAPKGVFRLRLQVRAHDPANEQVRVNVYSRLTTRTGFDDALGGRFDGVLIYPLSLDVTKLPSDPAGGVDVNIPINEAGTDPNIPIFYAAAGSGVFPLQVGVYDAAGNRQGQPLNTYLVYAEPYPASGLPKLSVSLVLPIHSAPTVDLKGHIGALPADQSRTLGDLVARLSRHPGVRLSLAVTPQTLDALAAGTAADRATLAQLAQLAETGHVAILPSTYVSVPMRGWDVVGLEDELTRQLDTGSSVLAGVFGATPSSHTWVVNGPVDATTLRLLASRGAKQFILPDPDLSALPVVARTTTFAVPTQLLGTGADTTVYGADVGLTADFSNRGGPVLAADQLLAELAMIQLETPGLTRGVAVLPPIGWGVDPTFVDTLLGGLEGHPLLNPVTASGLFGAVPVASVQRSVAVASSSVSSGAVPSGSASSSPGSGGATGSPSTSITTSESSASSASTASSAPVADAASQLGADADSIRSARDLLSGLAAVLPQAAQQSKALGRDLLTAESSELTETQRQTLLGLIFTASDRVTSLITLPRSSSITLTSTRGQLPLTVLSAPSLHARVELRLSSQRLIFHLAVSPDGKCRIPTPTSEVCDLTLTTQNTTLKVPVETRSSGVFPLDVSLWSPDGSQLLASDRDTVRSTAVSGVGIVLIAVTLISLAIWWGRDLRHGRRARQLVPAPIHEEDYHAEAGPSTNGQGQTAAPAEQDATIEDFFSTGNAEHEGYEQRPSEPRP